MIKNSTTLTIFPDRFSLLSIKTELSPVSNRITILKRLTLLVYRAEHLQLIAADITHILYICPITNKL